MKTWIQAGWIGVSLCLSIGAVADNGDDFNDDAKSATKWGDDIKLGGVVANEINGRLEFTCNNAATIGDTYRPWKLTRFPVNANWTLQVDTFNSTIPGVFGQVNSGGISLFHPTNNKSQIYVELYAVSGGKGFVANMETDDVATGNSDTATLVGDVAANSAVRMEYNAATKVVTCFYDLDISNGYQWTEFASYGVAGANGTTANTDWGLNNDQQFSVNLYGYSELMTITTGQLYLDNFFETGGAHPGAQPAVVPTGNYTFTFPTGNALLTAIAYLAGTYTGVTPRGSRPFTVDVAQDESGRLMAMGTVEGIADADGNSQLSGGVGSVTTVNDVPTARSKGAFVGTKDGDPASSKGEASLPLEIMDIGGGTNGVMGTVNGSGKVAGVPLVFKNEPVTKPVTAEDMANFKRDWGLQLIIEQKDINGKLQTVASAILTLPNGDQINFPERKARYSPTKGYKLSFKKGTNVTMNPATLDKKSSVAIKGLLFVQQGDEWTPTAGTIRYRFLGQKGTGDLMQFNMP